MPGGVPLPDLAHEISYFGVDLAAFSRQLAEFDPVAPLAWNDALASAARAHSLLMLDFDQQSRQLPGEDGLADRIIAAGYDDLSTARENVLAYTETALHGHAGFMVDWGYDGSCHVNRVAIACSLFAP